MPADRKLRLRHLFFDIGAEVREAWQQPLAETGYAAEGAFSLVSLLAPKVRAHIVLTGDPDDLDIFSSQMQAEPPVRKTSWLRPRPAGSPEAATFQRQTTPQAAPSFGQPQPISRLGRLGRPSRPCLPQGGAALHREAVTRCQMYM